jgi:hypothetical protein
MLRSAAYERKALMFRSETCSNGTPSLFPRSMMRSSMSVKLVAYVTS